MEVHSPRSNKPSFSLDFPSDLLQLGDNGVPPPMYSPYDMMESARFDAHDILSTFKRIIDTWMLLPDQLTEVSSLRDKLDKLVSHWEDIVDSLQTVKRDMEPLSLQVSDLQQELDALKEQKGELEREKDRELQKQAADYDQKMSEIQRELDEIVHLQIRKHKPPEQFGNILPSLFSEDDLREEQLVALGVAARVLKDEKIEKLQLSHESEGKWELQNSSEESEVLASELIPEEDKTVFYHIKALKEKVKEYRQKKEKLETEIPSLEKGFLASLAMESASDLDIQPRPHSFSGPESDFLPNPRLDFVLKCSGIAFTPGNEDYFQALHSSMSVSKRESLIYSLMNHLPDQFSRDVRLEDLLNVSNIRSQGTDSAIAGTLQNPEPGLAPRQSDLSEETKEFLDRENPHQKPFNCSGLSDIQDGVNTSQRDLAVISFEEKVGNRSRSDHFLIPRLNLELLAASHKASSPSFLKSKSLERSKSPEVELSAFQGESSISMVFDDAENSENGLRGIDKGGMGPFQDLEETKGEPHLSEKQLLKPIKPERSPVLPNPRRMLFRVLRHHETLNTQTYLSPKSLGQMKANTSVPIGEVMVSKPNSPAKMVANLRVRKYH